MAQVDSTRSSKGDLDSASSLTKPVSSSSSSPPLQPSAVNGTPSKDHSKPQQDTASSQPDSSAADIGAESTGPVVDMDVFGQLLEIDDDESHEFSKTLAFDYITQAETTFTEIEEALNKQDLEALSRKGHFLKGSSAALGLQRVQHSCEAMQHYGQRKDENGEGPLMSQDEALRKCRALLVRLRNEQNQAKDWLETFYKDKA